MEGWVGVMTYNKLVTQMRELAFNKQSESLTTRVPWDVREFLKLNGVFE